MSLVDVCYEQIKDNFYYGIFGDFKLIIDKSTGYFNATKLCVDGCKKFNDWSRSERSKRLMDYYTKSHYVKSRSDFLKVVKGDNKDTLDRQITGTYVPKEFILDIASWISIEFYDKCSNIIINYYSRDFKQYF